MSLFCENPRPWNTYFCPCCHDIIISSDIKMLNYDYFCIYFKQINKDSWSNVMTHIPTKTHRYIGAIWASEKSKPSQLSWRNYGWSVFIIVSILMLTFCQIVALSFPTTEGSIHKCLSSSVFVSPSPSLPLLNVEQPSPLSHVYYQSPHPGVGSHPRKTNQSNQKALLLECGFVTPTVISHLFNRCWKHVEDSFH